MRETKLRKKRIIGISLATFIFTFLFFTFFTSISAGDLNNSLNDTNQTNYTKPIYEKPEKIITHSVTFGDSLRNRKTYEITLTGNEKNYKVDSQLLDNGNILFKVFSPEIDKFNENKNKKGKFNSKGKYLKEKQTALRNRKNRLKERYKEVDNITQKEVFVYDQLPLKINNKNSNQIYKKYNGDQYYYEFEINPEDDKIFHFGETSGVGEQTASLEAYYKLNGSSGDVVDATGNGNDGTNNGATRGVTGKINDAFDFDKSNSEYVTTPLNFGDELAQDTAFSFSLWMKFESVNTLKYILSNEDSSGINFALRTTGDDDNPEFLIRDGNGNLKTIDTGVLNTGQWYHIVGTWDGSSNTDGMNLYVDGSNVGSNTLTTNSWYTSGGNIDIGRSENNGRYMDGKIDEVGIWDTALSQQDVWELYNQGHAREYPFDISTSVNSWRDLHNTRWDTNQDFNLNSDIGSGTAGWSDFASNTAHQNKTDIAGWIPLSITHPDGNGNFPETFDGNFNGNNHTIGNLNIDEDDLTTDSRREIGIFGDLGSNLTIKNLNIYDAFIMTPNSIGGGAGVIYSSTSSDPNSNQLTNISITDSTIYGGADIGIVAGSEYANSSNIRVLNSKIYCITATCGLLGGNLAGSKSNIYVRGEIDGEAGGDDEIGGFGGYINYGTAINNSYAVVDIYDLGSSTTDVGGFTGDLYSGGSNINITNSFWDTDVGLSTSEGGTGKTTSEMKTRSTFSNAGWDVAGEDLFSTSNIWGIGEPPEADSEVNSGYPFLQNFYGIDSEVTPTIQDPTIETDPATYIDETSAQFTGNLTDAGDYFDEYGKVELRFSYREIGSSWVHVDDSTINRTTLGACGYGLGSGTLNSGTDYEYVMEFYNQTEWIAPVEEVETFTTDTPVLNAPTGLQNEEITTSSFTGSWTEVSNATGYSYEVSITSNFSNIVKSQSITDTNFTSDVLADGETYYWRVKATAPSYENSNWTNSSVTIGQEKLNMPILLSNSNITNSSFISNWNAVTNATGYTLEVSTDAFYNNLVTALSIFEATSDSPTYYETTGLSSGITYYWRVKAIAPNYTDSNWAVSNVQTIGEEQNDSEQDDLEDSELLGGLTSGFVGLFPDSENLTSTQRYGFVFVIMILVTTFILAMTWSNAGGIPSAVMYVTLFLNFMLFMFFISIGYIGVGTLIILALLGIGASILKFRPRGI